MKQGNWILNRHIKIVILNEYSLTLKGRDKFIQCRPNWLGRAKAREGLLPLWGRCRPILDNHDVGGTCYRRGGGAGSGHAGER
jgi:hypothetical protein